MRTLIGTLRLALYLSLCATLIPAQALVLCFTRDKGAYVIPVVFHKMVCRLFNIRIETIGRPAANRHVVFISNHLSYLDIEVISAVMPTSFVAKEDVAHWPLFGILAKLQQTVFVSRDPAKAQAQRAVFEQALARPMPLVLFAEGTSSNGETVLPFKSSLFEPFLAKRLMLQPMTVVLTGIDGHPLAGPADRDRYAYYRDMVLAPHLWAFAKSRGADLRIVFHSPLDQARFTDRKALAQAAQISCAAGLVPAKDATEQAA